MHLDRKKQIDRLIGGLGIFLLKPAVIVLGRLLRREHDPRPRGDILVLKMLGGGSLVLAYPALESLKRSLPAGRALSLVTTPALVPFARELRIFDRVMTVDDSSFLSLVVSLARILAATLGKFDTCVDLEVHSRGTALLSLACGARNRLGFYKDTIYWRIGIYTHLVFYNTYSRSADFYAALIGLLGAPAQTLDEAAPGFARHFAVPEIPRSAALGFACSAQARERMLSPPQWVSAINNLKLSAPATVYLLGSAGDFAEAESLREAITAGTNLACVNECGAGDLGQTLRRIQSAEVFFGIDSGLLHLARLLGKDAVSYWGPTDPATRLAPRKNAFDVVNYEKISCSPCVHFAHNPPCLGRNRCVDALFDRAVGETHVSWSIVAGSQGPRPVERRP